MSSYYLFLINYSVFIVMHNVEISSLDSKSPTSNIMKKLFVHFSLFPKSLIKVKNVYLEVKDEIILFTGSTDQFGGVPLASCGKEALHVYCDSTYFLDDLLPSIDVMFSESSLAAVKFIEEFNSQQEYIDYLQRRLTIKHIASEIVTNTQITEISK